MVSLGVACISGSSNTASSPAAFAASSTGRNGIYLICYTDSKAHGITVSSVFHVPPVDQVTMLEESQLEVRGLGFFFWSLELAGIKGTADR
jgi:hypothetical protein